MQLFDWCGCETQASHTSCQLQTYGMFMHTGRCVAQSGISCREALGRTGTNLLAQGSDGIRLQSEVKLLDEQEGQYMIGSVQFTKPHKAPGPGSVTPPADMDASDSSRPSLDSVMGSARGQALLDSQVGKHKTITAGQVLPGVPSSVCLQLTYVCMTL